MDNAAFNASMATGRLNDSVRGTSDGTSFSPLETLSATEVGSVLR
jgi:hypothetical protein